MKGTLSFIFEILKIVILALVIVVPVRYFIFQPFIVRGVSMEPSFHNGDYLIIDEISYRFREPQRGEVVVFRYPLEPSQKFIKRIIGLPQEKIELEDGEILITDKFGQKEVLDELNYLANQIWFGNKEISLGENEYFVLGDNRMHSFDSRKWGALPRKNIVGRAVLRAWPPRALAYFPPPSY